MDNLICGLLIALLGGTALPSENFLMCCIHKYFHGIGLVNGLKFLDQIINVLLGVHMQRREYSAYKSPGPIYAVLVFNQYFWLLVYYR